MGKSQGLMALVGTQVGHDLFPSNESLALSGVARTGRDQALSCVGRTIDK